MDKYSSEPFSPRWGETSLAAFFGLCVSAFSWPIIVRENWKLAIQFNKINQHKKWRWRNYQPNNCRKSSTILMQLILTVHLLVYNVAGQFSHIKLEFFMCFELTVGRSRTYFTCSECELASIKLFLKVNCTWNNICFQCGVQETLV